MRMSTRVVLLLASMLLATAAARPHLPHTRPTSDGGPDLAFSNVAITATKATAGATVYFAGVSLYGGNYTLRTEAPGGTAVAGNDGTAVFSVPHGIPTRCVWIVVDGATGGYTVAAPHGE